MNVTRAEKLLLLTTLQVKMGEEKRKLAEYTRLLSHGHQHPECPCSPHDRLRISKQQEECEASLKVVHGLIDKVLSTGASE